jgi:hypothetical protein
MRHANPMLWPGGHKFVNICPKRQFLMSPAPPPIQLYRQKGNIFHFNLSTLSRGLQPV